MAGGNKTSGLCHDAAEGNCAHVRGLASHVSAGYDHNLRLAAREFGIVWDKTSCHPLFNYRVTPVTDHYSIAVIELRAHIIPGLCHFGKCCRDIKSCNSCGNCL